MGKLVGNTDGITIIGDSTGNILNQNARLAPLGFYGGSTMTHALFASSPAINAGTTTSAPLLDQRAAARVGATDIGAFEVNNVANGGSYAAALPGGRVGIGYSFTLTPEAGTTFYCVSSGVLPAGLTGLTDCPAILTEGKASTKLAPTAAIVLGGTPTQGGVFNFAVAATNGGDTNITNYSVTVLAPTAAGVSVAGRVLTSSGRGVANAVVSITDQNGVRRSVRTGSFGYFRFDDLGAGQVHTIEVNAKRYRFTPQVIVPTEDLTELTFVGW